MAEQLELIEQTPPAAPAEKAEPLSWLERAGLWMVGEGEKPVELMQLDHGSRTNGGDSA